MTFTHLKVKPGNSTVLKIVLKVLQQQKQLAVFWVKFFCHTCSAFFFKSGALNLYPTYSTAEPVILRCGSSSSSIVVRGNLARSFLPLVLLGMGYIIHLTKIQKQVQFRTELSEEKISKLGWASCFCCKKFSIVLFPALTIRRVKLVIFVIQQRIV